MRNEENRRNVSDSDEGLVERAKSRMKDPYAKKMIIAMVCLIVATIGIYFFRINFQ